MRFLRFSWLGAVLLPALALTQTVDCESAIVMDSSSGKILWSKNADEELYPASTTKIMTALLLLENCKPDEIIAAPEDVTKVRESSMHLRPGERIRAKDMLYALLLRSANDGCYAVATHIAGSVPKFSDLMNKRAKEIGCTHTHFDNPNGLNDKLHYTTAHDLALIGREAMKYPSFREIVHTQKTKINRSVNWKDLWMDNHNKILKRDPTCDGIKTGWTIPAGHCFVGAATREGWRVITVVMKSKSWENDTEALFDWAYATYGKQPELKAGDVCGNLNVSGGVSPQVPLVVDQDVYSLYKKSGAPTAAVRTLDAPPSVAAPVVTDKVLGKIVFQDQDGFQQTATVHASQPVMQSTKLPTLPASSNGKFLIAGGLLIGALYVRGRSRRRYQRIFS